MFKLKDYKNVRDFTGEILTPKTAILAKCYDCCCYERKEVKICGVTTCPLYNLKEKWLKKNITDCNQMDMLD